MRPRLAAASTGRTFRRIRSLAVASLGFPERGKETTPSRGRVEAGRRCAPAEFSLKRQPVTVVFQLTTAQLMKASIGFLTVKLRHLCANIILRV